MTKVMAIGILVVITAVVLAALVKSSKDASGTPRGMRDDRPAVRRFGRRKGEPLPKRGRRDRRLAASP